MIVTPEPNVRLRNIMMENKNYTKDEEILWKKTQPHGREGKCNHIVYVCIIIT